MQESSLFDPDDYPEAAQSDTALESTLQVVPDGLDLDVRKQMLKADDGLPARRVSLHSLDKAHYARYYADIVGTGMKKYGPLAWVELFSGPGRLYVKDTKQFEPGSPVQALTIRSRFNTYVFADLDKRCVSALDARIGSQENVHVIQGDANSPELHDAIVSLVPRDALVVLYADPQGLDLRFDTLKFFADRYQRCDLLLNFPVPGIDRALSAGQQKKAGQVLNHHNAVELIGPGTARSRTSVREFFERQLSTLGYEHFEREQVRLHQKNVALYDVLLASRDKLAKNFFQQAQKHGPHGQTALSLDV